MAIQRLFLVFLFSVLGFTATSYGFMALLQQSLPEISVFLVSLVVGTVIVTLCLSVFAIAQNTPVPQWRLKQSPVHALIVLGSGGHTAEMFSMLRRLESCTAKWTYHTYVVSSGDQFSAIKAIEFESDLSQGNPERTHYSIVTVPRARRVHQSYLTTPFTTLISFWHCLLVLCGRHPDQLHQQRPAQLPSPYPDLIITNGPATGVCVVLAARLLRLSHYVLSYLFPVNMPFHLFILRGAESFRLRTIFVESWARVTTLSFSGKLLLPFADRFLVQWPALDGIQAWWGMRRAEYVPGLVA